MSELPTILVTNGWKTDRNRKLTTIIIPSSVKTLQAPTKVTFMGTQLNVIPSNASTLQEIDAPNVTSYSGGTLFDTYSNLTTAKFPSLETITMSGSNTCFFKSSAVYTVDLSGLKTFSTASSSYGSVFYNCGNLVSLSLPELLQVSTNYATWQAGIVLQCNNLVSFTAPKLQSITGLLLSQCTGLQDLVLPSLQTTTDNNNRGAIYACTGLRTVQLGSTGHAVTGLGSKTFSSCTQSGLTITIYTNNGASLSGSPWGATNATIVYETA